jgi:CRP-like cAMP-binding protein
VTGDSLFDRLPDEERRALRAAAVRRKFAKGETIFHDGDLGDTLHVVERGLVTIRITTPLGDVATLTVLGPGQSFGEQAVLSVDSRRTASAVAVGPVETLAIGREQLDDVRRRLPVVDRFLVEALAEQVRRLTEHLLEALYVPADKRVLRRLLALDELGGQTDSDETLPFTQDDIAAMAGTTRPTANRVLKKAQAAGQIQLGRGRVTVLDREALSAAAR